MNGEDRICELLLCVANILSVFCSTNGRPHTVIEISELTFRIVIITNQ